MLSISTMAAAAMLGNVCGTNMANMNQYNAALYDNSNCTQSVCYQNGGQGLDTILSRTASRRPAISAAMAKAKGTVKPT